MSVTFYTPELPELDLNVSNANYHMLMVFIGETVDYCGTYAGADLDRLRTNIITTLERLDQEATLNIAIEPRVTRGAGGCTVIDCGRPANYIRDRLSALLELANAAHAAGKSLYFG